MSDRSTSTTDHAIAGVDAGTSVAITLAERQIADAAGSNRYRRVADGGIEQDMRKTGDDAAATPDKLIGKLLRGARRASYVGFTGRGTSA